LDKFNVTIFPDPYALTSDVHHPLKAAIKGILDSTKKNRYRKRHLEFFNCKATRGC